MRVRPPLRSRPNRLTVSLLLAAAWMMLAACGDSAKGPTEPSAPAGIAGRITSLVPNGNFRGTILVEFNPGSPANGPKAIVTVTGATTILTVARTEGEFRSLGIGQWVRVWFDGAVLDSYPVQGTAATVVIDSAGTAVTNRLALHR